ncbi:sodium:solute symporter family protein (plasmid) [Natrinema zhouii]|uniref:sodium:solute symporter family protein n=1 Tax=Natrinema zhouii TaxID=1710539 RepID=UPI001CFFFF42|nr:sodium:solute symporter family protein [Natrinema zhouii]UHQ98000.1 sodium:solute symporter family protein [Natrinema zhouii]
MVAINAFVIGIAISIVIYILIGGLAGRLVDDMADYYVAGRNAPTLLIVGTLVASFLSTVAFLGEMGFVYDGYGYLLLIMLPLNTAGYVIGSYFFGRYVYQMKPLTMPEYFGTRFNSTRVRVVAGVTLILGLSVYLVAVTQGLALLLGDIAEIRYGVSLFIIMIAYLSFTFYSGSQGVIITDTVMFLLFVGAAVIGGPLLIMAAGGWPDVIYQLAETSPDMVTWHGLMGEGDYMGGPIASLIWAMVIGCVYGIVVGISPWQTSRYIMAKDEHVILRSGLFSMGVILLLYLVLVLSVPSARLLNPDISPSEIVFVWASQNALPLGVGVVVVSGILAAGLSSCSTFLSLIGFSLNRDLAEVSNIDHLEGYTEDDYLRLSRLLMIAVALVVFAITFFQPPAVMWIGYFAAILFAASWGPIGFISIYSDRVTESGAFWGMSVGFITVIVVKGIERFGGVTVPVYLHAAIIGFVLSTLTIIVMSFITEPSEEAIKQRREMVASVSSYDKGKIKRTLGYTKYLAVMGATVAGILYVFWYRPFADAMGLSGMNGNITLVIYYGAVPIAFAALSYWLISRWKASPERTPDVTSTEQPNQAE